MMTTKFQIWYIEYILHIVQSALFYVLGSPAYGERRSKKAENVYP